MKTKRAMRFLAANQRVEASLCYAMLCYAMEEGRRLGDVCMDGWMDGWMYMHTTRYLEALFLGYGDVLQLKLQRQLRRHRSISPYRHIQYTAGQYYQRYKEEGCTCVCIRDGLPLLGWLVTDFWRQLEVGI